MNDKIIQNYIPFNFILVTMLNFIVGIYLSYNWLSYSISLFVGNGILLIFCLLGSNALELSSKILFPSGLIFIWLSTSYIAFNLEKLLRYLHYTNLKIDLTTEEIKKFLQIFPNEILIIDNDKRIEYINLSPGKNFLNINSLEEIKEYHNFEKNFAKFKELRFQNSMITLDDILKEPKILANKYQNKMFHFMKNDGAEESYTYKCIEMEFNNKKCIAFIFINENLHISLEKERSKSKSKQIMVTQITHDMIVPLNAMICAE